MRKKPHEFSSVHTSVEVLYISVLGIPIIPEAKEFKKLEERIVKRSLDIIMLKLIHQKPMSGYSLILFIHKKFGVKLSAGTVYSLLRSLEKRGLLEAHNKKNRRYTLTKKGERTLILLMNMQTRIKALNHDIFESSLIIQVKPSEST